MEDNEIIGLYWNRDEQAIVQTENKYGGRLSALAQRIVSSPEDAQECVSDTYLAAWNSMPTQWPEFLYAYLAKICRNCALGRLDWLNAAKRKAEVVGITREMELCIPDRREERRLEGEELGRLLNAFLGTISKESRMIFLRRYWFTDSIEEIAQRYGISQSKVKTSLHRTRNRLKTYLAKEGIAV